MGDVRLGIFEVNWRARTFVLLFLVEELVLEYGFVDKRSYATRRR